MKKVLVTGANKGIGFEVAKQLLEKGCYVILSARNEAAGEEAVKKLKNISGSISFLKMDVASEESIVEAAKTLITQKIKLDALINNAAILLNHENILEADSKSILNTFQTNTLGPIIVVQNFLKTLNNNGRVINVSSGWGAISSMADSPAAYSISKVGLNSVTKLFAHALKEKNISVNSVSPGWVRTAMGGENADRSIVEGAETIVWLADEAPQSLTNKFLRDKKEIDW